MDTHVIPTVRRSRLTVAAVLLALAIAVAVLTVQTRSIWSTPSDGVVQPPTAKLSPHAVGDELVSRDDGGNVVDRPSLREVKTKRSG